MKRTGTRGDDRLEGSDGPDELVGIAGADRLVGRGGEDRLVGGDGDDLLQGGLGNDVVQGGAGEDTASWADAAPTRTEFFTYGVNVRLANGIGAAAGLFYEAEPGRERDSLSGIENVLGSPYNDRLVGDAGANALDGAAGDDLIFGLAGADRLRGGDGNDDVDGGDGADALHGGGGQDFIFGKGGADRVDAGGDDDRVTGGPGDDVMIGGAGDDIFFDASLIAVTPADGSDVISGGLGFDAVDYTDDDAKITVDLATGLARQAGEVDILAGIESVSGTAFDDRLAGGAGDDVLEGGFGRDLLTGLAGDDTLTDAGDASTLDGGEGDDRLRGGTGDDLLRGGSGRDVLNGDTGDSFGFDDRLFLGDDAAADTAGFELYRESFLFSGIGVDRVAAFDEGRDRLVFDLHEERGGFDGPAERYVVDTRDFLDSNDDGRLTDADREVRGAGADLILDLDAVYARALDSDFFEGSDQHVVLSGVGASVDAGQVAAARTEAGNGALVGEDFVF